MRVSGIPYVQGRNSYTDTDGAKYGIAIHNTSNDASAEAEASYGARRTDGVSAHFYCDADSVIQSLDTTAKAGHAGSRVGNENAIAVEITGVNSWPRQQWLDGVAWDLLGLTLAQVCRAHGIQVRRASVSEMRTNPKVKAFYSHDDMRQAWGGTTHTDPGPNFPWDRLFEAVNGTQGAAMAQLDDVQAAVNRIEQGSVVPSNALIYWIRAIAEGRQSGASGGPNQGPDRDGIPEVLAAIAELPAGLAAQIAIALAANPAFINAIADPVAAAVGAKIGGVLTDIINGSTITGTIQAPTA